MAPLDRARLSLDGLSVGDALGQRFFGGPGGVRARIEARRLPEGPWIYTDDTEMAISVFEVLEARGAIDPDRLAQKFAQRYQPHRGYGAGAHGLLQAIRQGADWREAAQAMFGGTGSYGNGSAMRVAPVGAYFASDLDAAVTNAERSAVTTHTHPEGAAGAIAVAVAAALASRVGEGGAIAPGAYIDAVLERVPPSETREGILAAAKIPLDTPPTEAAGALGAGERISCPDTVPFCVWCAARHLDSYEEAFWATVSGLGDRDTTCAIVGGIVALSDRAPGIPPRWLRLRERLPLQVDQNAPTPTT